MGKICSQINIPQVDNTNIECDEFMYSTCIIVKQLCSKVKNLEGENLDKFIERLCNKISKIDNELYLLNQEIKSLKNRINILENV